MQVTLPYSVVLLRRSENEKVPLVVLPHEVEVIKALHGPESVILTDDKPPVKESTFDTAEEYARLEGMYIGNENVRYPVREALGDLEDFEESLEELGGDDVKLALIEKAKSLGLKATKNWGIEKLEAEIAEAEAKAQ